MRRMKPTHPLTRYRAQHGLTLTALAERASLSKGYLSSIESGESFSIDTAEALVLATGGKVTLEELAAARRKGAA
ncbi:MAG: XRE family transcriptional regulator [Betaproteobacteria bacterium]|jgi:transcriptional regulator with XRE-family HTH domain|nr:XRE family transcriptional regulator [Betaproteobacteria bacterium]